MTIGAGTSIDDEFAAEAVTENEGASIAAAGAVEHSAAAADSAFGVPAVGQPSAGSPRPTPVGNGAIQSTDRVSADWNALGAQQPQAPIETLTEGYASAETTTPAEPLREDAAPSQVAAAAEGENRVVAPEEDVEQPMGKAESSETPAIPTQDSFAAAATPAGPEGVQPADRRPTPISTPSARRPLFSRPPLTPPASAPAMPRSVGAPTPKPPMGPARPPFAARPSGVGPLAAPRASGIAPPPLVGPSGIRPLSEPTTSMQAGGQVQPSTRPRTPINPFLANDPNAKARRLSRALVSDLVTYFPDRRDEGIREGTLRELFREEIKKSYEEYVDQVGRDFADSTTHFQDALNEILAAGQKLF